MADWREKPCRVWNGKTNNKGYGIIGYKNRRQVFAHRDAYERENGPIPLGMEVCHHCDTPSCYEPSHLFAGTRKQNMDDASSKGRLWQNKVTHCPQGHEYNDDNTYVLHGRRYCRLCVKAAKKRYAEKRKKPSRNTSGTIGVSRVNRSGKWHAYGRRDGKRVHLGIFASLEEAVLARKTFCAEEDEIEAEGQVAV